MCGRGPVCQTGQGVGKCESDACQVYIPGKGLTLSPAQPQPFCGTVGQGIFQLKPLGHTASHGGLSGEACGAAVRGPAHSLPLCMAAEYMTGDTGNMV